MEHIIAFLVVYMMICVIHCLPIENGFAVKFTPISAREDLNTKSFGTMFAKIPQQTKRPEDESRRDILNKALYPQSAELGSGYTNQVAKLVVTPTVPPEYNVTESWNNNNNMNFLNLPMISQPYNNYKILIAAAPPNLSVSLGGDKKKMVVYVVFPEDGSSDIDFDDIPRIYFVNENKATTKMNKKEVVDPILVVDSNRTVTGLKSKEIAKFLRFKNKLTNRFNYKTAR